MVTAAREVRRESLPTRTEDLPRHLETDLDRGPAAGRQDRFNPMTVDVRESDSALDDSAYPKAGRIRDALGDLREAKDPRGGQRHWRNRGGAPAGFWLPVTP